MAVPAGIGGGLILLALGALALVGVVIGFLWLVINNHKNGYSDDK